MKDHPKTTHLVVFFTWDVSLKLWHEKGMLTREVRYYNELAAKNIKITFLTWGDHDDANFASQLHQNIHITPLYTLIPRPQNKLLRAICSFFMLWSVRHVLRTASLFKTNQMWGAWCAVLAKMFYRKPLILRSGFELMRFTIMHGHGAFRQRFISVLSRFAYHRADLIYLATHEDADFVQRRFHVAKDKISVRPNWIDVSIFAPQQVDKQDNQILFIGRLTDQKNIPLLIDAVSMMPDHVSLNIVGQGELEERLKEYAATKKAKIKFLGRIDNTDLPRLISEHAVFVLPSKFEGNPKTLLEAMSCGAAVVGTNVDGISSVIKNDLSGCLAGENAEDLALKLSDVLQDKSKQRELGVAARQQIIDTHDINHLISLEFNDYTQLLGKTS